MSNDVYTTGQLLHVTAAFEALDTDGVTYVSCDPTTVTFSYRTPAGTTVAWVFGTDSQVVKDSVGHYHADISLSLSGDYFFRIEGTGTAAVAIEDFCYVLPTTVPAPPP